MALFNKKSDNKEDDKKAPAKPLVAPAAPAVVKKEAKPTAAEGTSMKDLYKEEVKTTAAKIAKNKTLRAYKVLVKPLVTEKATNLGALNKYVFMVDRDANKISVAAAIFEVYGLKPADVNIVKVKGKKVLRGQISGRRKDWKKAIVTLPKGKTIKVYEGV
jgi:large subunit ribosomal protein L23